MRSARWVAAALGLWLAACDMPGGGDEAEKEAAAEPEGRPAAEGKAEEGRLSLQAPGVDIAITVPESVRGKARAETNSEFLPPGTAVRGIHIAGDGGRRAGGRDSVELRFASEQPVEQVAAWYREPARARHFRVDSARREGEETVLSGTNREGGPFTVRLRAREGGTDGRLLLVDRD